MKLNSFDPNTSYRFRTLNELNVLSSTINESKSKLSMSLQYYLKKYRQILDIPRLCRYGHRFHQPEPEILFRSEAFSLYILKKPIDDQEERRTLTEEFHKEEKIEPIITKMAKTDYPISEIISRRWSARAFSTKPVEKLKLLSVLEAARWAPSSRNEQPWRYIVFTNDNPEKLKKAQSVLKEINDYAKRAPILICAITKRTYTDNSLPNRLHFHDLGAANENMFLEAFSQGLIMHEMGGFDVQMAREVFNIPEDYEVGIMIAIGYQDTYHVLPERLKEKAFTPRVRKPLYEIVFVEEFGYRISLQQAEV